MEEQLSRAKSRLLISGAALGFAALILLLCLVRHGFNASVALILFCLLVLFLSNRSRYNRLKEQARQADAQ